MQETVKRDIDSGILNNTNRTHEFVDLLAKLEADKGVLFDFTNNAKIKETGFAIEGKQVNGYVQGNNIAINIDSTSALNKVVGHEIAHVLEGTELYTELANAVKELATTKGEYDSKLQSITKLYEGIEDANIENELTADLIGEYLFTDSDFINRLSAEKPTLFQKIFDEIKYLCKVATAGSKEAKQLEKVKKTFEEAYRQKNNTAIDDGVKYSMAGVQSKTADNSLLLKAEQMLESGVDSESVRQETGWYKGYDGEWRYEIDDSKMALIRQGSEIINYGMLDELISHDELFEAYPHLRYMGVIFQDLGGKLGSYSRQFGDINIDSSLKNNPEELKNVLIHEIQHAIQDIEGLTHGSSPLYWEEQLKKNSDIGKTAEQKHELEELETKYREIENNNPDFFNEMIELAEMEPDIPRGEMDWDTLEQIEEDPIEWQRYDEKRDALSEKYSESQVIDFMLLQDKIQRIKASGRTARDLYWDTAGEIEARDTTKRLNLNSEQRKNTRPDIDRTDVVFAGDSGIGYSIKQTRNIDYLKQLELVESKKLNGSNSIYVGEVASGLLNAGLSNAPFAMNQSDFRKSRRESSKNKNYSKHGIKIKFFKQLPQKLNEAVMFIDNGEKITVVTDSLMSDSKGNPSYIIVGIWKNQKMDNDTVNQIKSVYPLDDFAKQIAKSAEMGTLVITNKNKANDLLAPIGIQPSQRSKIINLAKTSVSQSNIDVKKNSLTDNIDDIAPVGNNVYGENIKLQLASAEDIAPIGENVVRKSTESENTIIDGDEAIQKIQSMEKTESTTHEDLVKQMSDIMDEATENDGEKNLPDYFVDGQNKKETKSKRKTLHANIIAGFKSKFNKLKGRASNSSFSYITLMNF